MSLPTRERLLSASSGPWSRGVRYRWCHSAPKLMASAPGPPRAFTRPRLPTKPPVASPLDSLEFNGGKSSPSMVASTIPLRSPPGFTVITSKVAATTIRVNAPASSPSSSSPSPGSNPQSPGRRPPPIFSSLPPPKISLSEQLVKAGVTPIGANRSQADTAAASRLNGASKPAEVSPLSKLNGSTSKPAELFSLPRMNGSVSKTSLNGASNVSSSLSPSSSSLNSSSSSSLSPSSPSNIGSMAAFSARMNGASSSPLSPATSPRMTASPLVNPYTASPIPRPAEPQFLSPAVNPAANENLLQGLRNNASEIAVDAKNGKHQQARENTRMHLAGFLMKKGARTLPEPPPFRKSWLKSDTDSVASPLASFNRMSTVDQRLESAATKTALLKPDNVSGLRQALMLSRTLSHEAPQKPDSRAASLYEYDWQQWERRHSELANAEPEPPRVVPKPEAKDLVQRVFLTRRMKVQDFSKLTGIGTNALLGSLVQNNLAPPNVTPDAVIDTNDQEVLCMEFNRIPVFPNRAIEKQASVGSTGERRPPVVCVMGHVDHGKTTLMDRLRKTNLQALEAGGITQSIGAFSLESGAVFLDTPGHAAFASMRARGASKHTADVVVLVVALDSGVQPQTVEAIELAKKNDIPIVVALNKCDLDGDRGLIRRQLLQHGVQEDVRGGDTMFVEISAKSGKGLAELQQAVTLTAEMLDLRAPVDCSVQACVLETSQQQGHGCVVNTVVRHGTIKVGDWVVYGAECTRVKALITERGEKISSCGPCTPVAVVGFKTLSSTVPGTMLVGVASEEEGERIVGQRRAMQMEKMYLQGLTQTQAITEELTSVQEAGELPTLRIILKAEAQGGLDALMHYIERLPQDSVKTMVLRASVGPFNEGDVQMAAQLGAKMFGFGPESATPVTLTARSKEVELHTRKIIYELMDDIRGALGKLLPMVDKIDTLGHARVLQAFQRSGKKRSVVHAAGCQVTQGKLCSRDPKGGTVHYRVLRDGVEVQTATLDKLFRFKDEVQTIEKGLECCVVLQGMTEFQVGDVLECRTVSRVHTVFDDTVARGASDNPGKLR